jgi:hypothetical protein
LFHCIRVSGLGLAAWAHRLATASDLYPPGCSPSRDFPRDTAFRCFQRIPRAVSTACGSCSASRSASPRFLAESGLQLAPRAWPQIRRPETGAAPPGLSARNFTWTTGRNLASGPLRFFASTEVRRTPVMKRIPALRPPEVFAAPSRALPLQGPSRRQRWAPPLLMRPRS